MPRPRKPLELLSPGNLRHNRKRYSDRGTIPRAEPLKGRGSAPADLNSDEIAIWRELHAMAPAGLLTRMDIFALRMMCQLEVKERSGAIGPSERQMLLGLYRDFGMTVASRTRVPAAAPKPKDKRNAFSQFA
jgi:phage terminase small subunit